MKDFPSCFGENVVQVADSSSSTTTKNAQNMVTCVYHCKLDDRQCLMSITWTKNLMGQGLRVAIDDALSTQCLCKVDMKPWLFSKRKGCKSLEVESSKVDIYWDLSNPKFGSSPEPLEGYYLAVVFNQKIVLLIGDIKEDAYKKIEGIEGIQAEPNAILISKRENIFGKKCYSAKAQFCDQGQMHDVVIECDTINLKDPCLVIRIDNKIVLQVKKINWKFRGNHTIWVDGLPVQVFWDVHDWLFGDAMGNAVFMFQTSHSAEKFKASQSSLDPPVLARYYSQGCTDNQCQCLGFSLMLYAWKNEKISSI